MKRIKIFYWVFTVLFSVLMLFSAIPDIILTPDTIEIVSKQMGYPEYILPFLGVAKLLGVVALFIPGFPRVKEWAYAGLFFDLTGATYSAASLGTPALQMSPMLLFFGLGIGSYIFYHKKLRATEK